MDGLCGGFGGGGGGGGGGFCGYILARSDPRSFTFFFGSPFH